jgi:hypothetical protein
MFFVSLLGSNSAYCAGGRSAAKTQEQLDKELDAYMLKDPKSATARLDSDLDDYMNKRNQPKTDTPAAGADASAAETETNGSN